MQKNDSTSQGLVSVLPYLESEVCYGGLVAFCVYCATMWQELDETVSMVIKDEQNLLGAGLGGSDVFFHCMFSQQDSGS